MRASRRPVLAAVALAVAVAGLAGAVPAVAAPGVAVPAGDAPLPPSLARMLEGLPSGGTLRVLVTLRDQPAVGRPPVRPRGDRLRAVIDGLKRQTALSQASLHSRLRTLATQGEVTAERRLWVANAVSVDATAAAIRELAARPDVARVTPDAITITPASAPAEPNIATLGAPELWAAGQRGQGVVVATLDTGVDLANPDLAASWRGGSNSWFDPYGQHATTPVDLSGHGTATTGAIVGAEDAGAAYGMAPGAQWIAARIFDDGGTASTTAIHEAFQWLLDPDGDPATADAPQVVNGSWAIGTGPSCDLTFRPDVQALRAAGIIPVFSAGNFGPYAATSASPANYPESLAVGAVDAGDRIWGYTSAGPSTCGGRGRVFPDLVAPGVSVLAADRYDGYTYLSGTSIAAPQVAGALALLLGAHPGLAPGAAEEALTATALDLGVAGPDERYGAGRIDVAVAHAALTPVPAADLAITLDPAAVATPAGGAVSLLVTASPSNGVDAATSLAVDGLPAEAFGSFYPTTLGPGAWTTTLSIDTTTALAPGDYPLTVTALGGGLTRTATATLTVTAPQPDFTMSTPGTVTVKRGRTASFPITVDAVGGLTGRVVLASGSTPPGTTPKWTKRAVTVPKTVTWRLATSSLTAPGTYLVVLTGSMRKGPTHQLVLTLVVR